MRKYFTFLILVTITFSSFGQALTAKTSATVAHCGGRDGTVIVIASGGTGTYTYLWNCIPKQTTSTATQLSAGTYTVTVSDGKETITATATIIDWSRDIQTIKRMYMHYAYLLLPFFLGFA